MKTFARPGVVALLLSLAAILLHPLSHAGTWLTGHSLLLPTFLLLAAFGLLVRAVRSTRAEPVRHERRLLAAGAILTLLGVGLDGVLGRDGTLRLAIGAVASNFEETDPQGRPLGLRPLGFRIGVETVVPGGVSLSLPERGLVPLTSGRALAFGGFRLSSPQVGKTGAADLLRIAVSDGTKTAVAEVAPGRTGEAFGARVALEQYFPDFALDERQQPFTRSLEPRNPAALLSAEREGRSYRAFVIQSMPGVHRVEGLGLTFSLLEVDPEEQVTLGVHRRPFAPLIAAGALLLMAAAAVSLTGGAREAPLARGDGVLVATSALAVLLLLADGGAVVRWRFGVAGGDGRIALVGVGVLLGCALLLSLASALLQGAQRLAPELDVRGAARLSAWLSVGVGAAGVVLAAIRLAAAPAGLAFGTVSPVLAIALLLLLLALALRPPRSLAPLLAPFAWLLTVAAAVVIGMASLQARGTYTTAPTAAAAAAALLALAACEPTGLAGLRRFLAVVGAALLLLTR